MQYASIGCQRGYVDDAFPEEAMQNFMFCIPTLYSKLVHVLAIIGDTLKYQSLPFFPCACTCCLALFRMEFQNRPKPNDNGPTDH